MASFGSEPGFLPQFGGDYWLIRHSDYILEVPYKKLEIEERKNYLIYWNGNNPTVFNEEIMSKLPRQVERLRLIQPPSYQQTPTHVKRVKHVGDLPGDFCDWIKRSNVNVLVIESRAISLDFIAAVMENKHLQGLEINDCPGHPLDYCPILTLHPTLKEYSFGPLCKQIRGGFGWEYHTQIRRRGPALYKSLWMILPFDLCRQIIDYDIGSQAKTHNERFGVKDG